MTDNYKGLLNDVLEVLDEVVDAIEHDYDRESMILLAEWVRNEKSKLQAFIDDVPEWLRQAILDKQQLQRKGKAKSYIITEAAEMLADAVEVKDE